jgi:hypothetical protein
MAERKITLRVTQFGAMKVEENVGCSHAPGSIQKTSQVLGIPGERTGIRTQDLLIKSQLLYLLSYALPRVRPYPRNGSLISNRLALVNIHPRQETGNLFALPPLC